MYEETYAGTNGYPVKVYLNPGDPSADETVRIEGRAASGYAANLQVFGRTTT
jgi:hypothetical protein